MRYRLSGGEKLGISAFLIICILILGCFVGYISNIVKLVHCDFEAPYKAEICRGVGIFVPPIGIIEGYININDRKNK